MVVYTSTKKLHDLKWIDNEIGLNALTPLQIQKFLFFNEMFSKNKGLEYDLDRLKAYERGPVFSATYGDLLYDKRDIIKKISTLELEFNAVQIKTMLESLFLVTTHTDEELSNLTHEFDLWKNKFRKGENNIDICESDITEEDTKKLQMINSLLDYEEKEIIPMGDKRFVFNKGEVDNLNEELIQTLEELSEIDELVNPVYITLEDGELLVD